MTFFIQSLLIHKLSCFGGGGGGPDPAIERAAIQAQRDAEKATADAKLLADKEASSGADLEAYNRRRKLLEGTAQSEEDVQKKKRTLLGAAL